jgi:hypothetical protein
MAPLQQETAQSAVPASTLFSAQERRTLRLLRARYRQDHDMFTERERTHLRFARWLYRAGRLES